MRRLIVGFMTILLTLMFAFPVYAADSQVLSLGRISVAMPKIVAEIKGDGYATKDVSAKLGSETLRVESAVEFSKKHSVCAYILVDLSTSMVRSFDLVKKNIISVVDGMGADDEVVVLTFGESKVVSLLNGNESKDEIKGKINALKCNEGGTLFYEALSQAYQMSNARMSEYDREYVIAFSDGIDVQRGSTTYDEIKESYETHTLPIYAACASNASQSAVDRFGNLARSSGGSLKMISDKDDFSELMKEINDVTLVTLKAGNNVADGQKKQLSIKVRNSQVEYDVPITRAMEDNIAPTVTKIQFIAESKVLVVEFSEAVSSATAVSSYKIANKAGKTVGIESIEANDSNTKAELKLGDDVSNGEYTVSFSGITDCSTEKNELKDTKKVVIEGISGSAGLLIGIIVAVAVVVLLAVALIVVILLKNSKKQEDSDEFDTVNPNVLNKVMEHEVPQIVNEKHHIKAKNVTRIRMRIITGRTSEQNIETNLVSSLIVGRSNTCDIYIDDTKLSRQHFVIESDGNAIYIMDLQSRNGTTLNGIRVNSRQVLHSGDKIAAGLSDIYITILE